VQAEIDSLEAMLKEKGFQVTRINNPNGEELQNAFLDFIARYGYLEDNRLLFSIPAMGIPEKTVPWGIWSRLMPRTRKKTSRDFSARPCP
jgi:hypothetical protein